MVASDDELPFLDPGLTARTAVNPDYEKVALRECDRLEETKRHQGIFLSPPCKQKKGKRRQKKKKYIPYTSRTHSQTETKKEGKIRRFSVNTVTSIPEENSEDVISSDPDIETVEYVTNSNDNQNTVQSIHQIFAELDELVYEEGEQMWEEKSRWLKFEQDMYRAADKWSKPRVATLTLHSLINLRKCINSGTVFLGMNAFDLESVIELLLDRLVAQAQITSTSATKLKDLLLKRHVHTGQAKLKLKNLSNGQGLLSRVADSFTPTSTPPDSRVGSRSNSEQDLSKTKQQFLRKLPADAEASNVMVGQVDYLTQSLCVVIRLKHSILLGNMTEVPIPTRFMFLLLCPTTSSEQINHMEIGRAASTLFTDEMFYKAAYTAQSKSDLIRGIDRFLEKAIVIPPGEWSPKMKITLPEEEELSPELLDDKGEEDVEQIEKTFKRPFTGILNDMRALSKRWCKDWKRGIHLIPSLAPLHFVVVLLSYILILADQCYQTLDVTPFSCLTSVAVCGLVLSIISCQPLLVFSVSLPIVMWEVAASSICDMFSVVYTDIRTIVGIVCGMSLILASFLNIANIFPALSMFLFESVLCAVCLAVVVLVCISVVRTYYMGATLLTGSLVLVLTTLIFLKIWHGLTSSTLFRRKIREVLRLLDGVILLLLVALIINITPIQTIPFSTKYIGSVFLFRTYLPPPAWIMGTILGLVLFLLITLIFSSVFNWATQPKHKLKRLHGKYSDLALTGVMIILCSLYHFPFIVPDPFLTCMFIQSISVKSKTPPNSIIYIREQRLSQFFGNILLVVPAMFLSNLHNVVPVPVCWSVVMFYSGKCISDTQFYERIKLFAQAEKYQPETGYVTKTPVRVIHIYTSAQIVVVIIITVFLTAPYSTVTLPLVLLLILGARHLLMPNFLYEYFLHTLEDRVSPPLSSPEPMCEPGIIAFSEEVTKITVGVNEAEKRENTTGPPTFSTQVIFDCLTDTDVNVKPVPLNDTDYNFPRIVINGCEKADKPSSPLDCMESGLPSHISQLPFEQSDEIITYTPPYRSDRSDDHGATFLDNRETFLNNNNVATSLDHRETFLDHGEIFLDHGETFLDHGETFLDHGETFLENGALLDDGINGLDNGATFLDHGEMLLDHRARRKVLDNGATNLDNGATFDDHGATFLDNGVSFNEHGETFFDNCTL